MATHLAIAIGALLVLGIAVDRLMERRAFDDLVARLDSQARAARVTIDRTPSAGLQSLVRALGDSSSTRLTVIRTDGVVLADSEREPATMQNHATRPEVRAALAGVAGTDLRTSETTGLPSLYLALPPSQGTIVRAALPAAVLSEQHREIRVAIAVSFAALALVAAGLAVLIARSIARPLDRISRSVEGVARGEFERVEPEGPKEARALAGAVNRMALDLAARLDQLHSETALREQILSSMDEGVILTERDRVVYANPAARVLFGVEEMPMLPAAVPTPEGGAPAIAEFTLHHPVYRDVRCVSARVGPAQFLVVAQDVTEAKRVERIRRDFVANASHELKTPVAGILATAETLEDAMERDPEAAERFAASLKKEATRLSSLVQDLLSLARLEQRAESHALVSFSDVVREKVDQARALGREKAIELTADIQDGVRMTGSAEDLALMVRNLLDNAIRYTPERGAASVSLTTRDGMATLEVRDTGIGIPANDLPRIFERFYRVDRARSRETGGTGLGLSIVRHVAESHGGSVTAISELGTGSRFTVRLPTG